MRKRLVINTVANGGDKVRIKVVEQSHVAGTFGNEDSGHGRGQNKFKASNGVVLATWGYPDYVERSKCNDNGKAFFFRGTDRNHDNREFDIPASMAGALIDAVREYNATEFSDPASGDAARCEVDRSYKVMCEKIRRVATNNPGIVADCLRDELAEAFSD